MSTRSLTLPCALTLLLAAGGVGMAEEARADAAPTRPSKHQMMKECMAKQKASDSGIPKEQMKKNCHDVVDMKSENAAVDKRAEQKANPTNP